MFFGWLKFAFKHSKGNSDLKFQS